MLAQPTGSINPLPHLDCGSLPPPTPFRLWVPAPTYPIWTVGPTSTYPIWAVGACPCSPPAPPTLLTLLCQRPSHWFCVMKPPQAVYVKSDPSYHCFDTKKWSPQLSEPSLYLFTHPIPFTPGAKVVKVLPLKTGPLARARTASSAEWF